MHSLFFEKVLVILKLHTKYANFKLGVLYPLKGPFQCSWLSIFKEDILSITVVTPSIHNASLKWKWIWKSMYWFLQFKKKEKLWVKKYLINGLFCSKTIHPLRKLSMGIFYLERGNVQAKQLNCSIVYKKAIFPPPTHFRICCIEMVCPNTVKVARLAKLMI